MNIKFNFYDIYGFALPGFLLLAVLWLPFGLIEGKWPDAEFSSALLGVILAYFAGHILQTIAHSALPSNLIKGRYPSSVFLDEDDGTFSFVFKERLEEKIDNAFKIPVNLRIELFNEVFHERLRTLQDKIRGDAFFLCRSALLKNKTAVYAEQFEGLYALMRGLSAGFGIAVVYYLGWAGSGLLQFVKLTRFMPAGLWSWQGSGLVVLLGILIALAAIVNATRFVYAKQVMTGSLFVAAFASGYHLGLSRIVTPEQRGILSAAAVFSFFAAERCYAGYKIFAQEFVKAVYRDFINLDSPPAAPAAANGDDDEP